jgi:hypothetical protein
VPSRVIPVVFGPDRALAFANLNLTFVLVLKPEGFMTASSLLDSRRNPFPSPILITDNDSGRAHRFIALANHLDIRALKCHNFYQFTVSNFVNPLQAL